MSSLNMRMQPYEAKVPIECGRCYCGNGIGARMRCFRGFRSRHLTCLKGIAPTGL